MTIGNRMRKRESPNEVIASNDDLLTELLLRLPIKSLLKFKSVCKHWLALITDPDFIRRRNLESKAVSALYFHSCSSDYGSCNEFVPLDASQRRARFDYLKVADLRILESCKGLFLCRSIRGDCKYLVYNPTTNQFKTLPPIPILAGTRVLGFSLAFDSSLSPSYKVVCVVGGKSSHDGCRILIYSSQSQTVSGSWRVAGPPFTASRHAEFEEAGVYCNGAIHWFSWMDISHYFDLDEELVRKMPMPPHLQDSDFGRLRYFGESGGHLHLVNYYWAYITIELNVHEMERDRSGWFVKFRLDQAVFASFPAPSYPVKVLCVVRGEREEDSFLVVRISNARNQNNAEFIRYNFISQTHEVIGDIDSSRKHPWPRVYQYIESLSFV